MPDLFEMLRFSSGTLHIQKETKQPYGLNYSFLSSLLYFYLSIFLLFLLVFLTTISRTLEYQLRLKREMPQGNASYSSARPLLKFLHLCPAATQTLGPALD